MGLAVVAVIAFAVQAKSWSVLATGLMVAAAAGFTGALFGFIFGVPRVLASDQPRAQDGGPGSTAPIVANTNLEQISDWLAKILVGVGLTQFGPIGRAAGVLFTALAPAFSAGGAGQGAGAVFAGGLILYMVTFGFSTGWLFTRLFLGKAMATADGSAAAADLMDKAELAEQEGDEPLARAYRSQARGALESSEAASMLSWDLPLAHHDSLAHYEGPATVSSNSRQVQVEATLRSWRDQRSGQSEWGGRATASIDDIDITNVGEAKIRLPDGREGDVIIANASIGSSSPGARLRLIGSGPPPF